MWKIFARYDDYTDRIVVAAAHTDHTGRRSFAQGPLLLKPRDSAGSYIDDKDVDLMGGMDGQAFLQAMLEAAWELGLRPNGFKDHTNELTAVRYHLEDMRKLAKVK